MKSEMNIKIHEIVLRDGLQNITGFVPTEKKIDLLNLLVDAGVLFLESTAFVSPKWVPQMADAKEVFKKADERKGIRNSVLVPNYKGFQIASDCGAGEIVPVMSASENHNKANVNKSIEESLIELKEIGEFAKKKGIVVRANIATAFGYKSDDVVEHASVVSISRSLEESGYSGITLCDTTGVASPEKVYELIQELKKHIKRAEIAVHFHQNHSIEFANIFAAYQAGVRVFESAAGGLGGCPFAEDANGNVPTENLVRMFLRMGLDCGINLEKIEKAALYAKEIQKVYSKSGPSIEVS